MTAEAEPTCRVGEACYWSVVEAKLRQARKPRTHVPPWQRDRAKTYNIFSPPTYCDYGHVFTDNAEIDRFGRAFCQACKDEADATSRPYKPAIDHTPIDLATTGGKGLAPLIERDPNTIESALRRERISLYNNLRAQLRAGRNIEWNHSATPPYHRDDLPEGIGVYTTPLTDDERAALIARIATLKKELHV